MGAVDDWPFDLNPDLDPLAYLSRAGAVFATFDARTQDSGNVSFGVETEGHRWFVKTAGSPSDPTPFLSHPARVELLRNAARIARTATHPALPAFHGTAPSAWGPMLIYEWVDGELVGAPTARRTDPASAYRLFRCLPQHELTVAINTLLDVHIELSRTGWVASDFYDGAVIYDFEHRRTFLIDIDNYRLGAFANPMGRLFGSTRFMAPEEFELGAQIDERTTVFNLGRAIAEFMGDGSLNRASFRGSEDQYQAMVAGCQSAPTNRPTSVTELAAMWRSCFSI